MASNEGVQAGGSGAGGDKKRAAEGAPQPGSNGGASAAPKTPAAATAAAPKTPPQAAIAQPAAADSEDLVVVTLKASTGSIVSVEMAAPDGSRHALTDSETQRLVGERPTFASLVHDAFEAGIACVLDEGASGADERSGETEEDVDLHDALLDALIERSTAKRLLSNETLHSAVLGTIIHAASGNGKAPAPPAA
jgi:hypothetical protein